MNVLVTGGAGFIGSHLAEKLVNGGNHVSAIDDLSTGSLDNVRPLLANPLFEFARRDVRDRADLNVDPPVPQRIYHMAAGVGVRNILERPLSSLETNLRGTENVLAAAAEWGSEVVISSTSEVYGKNDAVPLTEESDRLMGSGEIARWWYAVAKMADEALALANHREKGVRALVVRFFNAVGPRQTGRYGMVMPTLVAQALAGTDLTVYGDGNQTRCFTYIHDVIDALTALADVPTAYGRIYNIGQPAEISINALAQRILELTRSRSRVVHVPYAEAYDGSYEDMRRRIPDCTRLRDTIGWSPTDRLDEAILAIAEDLQARGLAVCGPA